VSSLEPSLAQARSALAAADALLVTAGAGMGVDSGLPDFRGDAGFWKAYPPFAKLGLRFQDLASPRWFAEDPARAWGFYGHRLALYRATVPHRGFERLRAWSRDREHGAFVFTSNVDGHFQKAGFDPARVVECHGAIETSQCAAPCCDELFPTAQGVAVDPESFRAAEPLPRCPRCGGMARPNILMFGDGDFLGARTDAQEARLGAWLRGLAAAGARLVVLELGAGTSVPTVRLTSESIARRLGGILVRINPREPDVPPGGISIAAGALEALEGLRREGGPELPEAL
jgi:NAD-dependent SIR2 family protein deacetylase